MNNTLLRDLFIENPMLDEATRMRRKFSRGGTGRGRVLYYGVGALLVFIFMWSIGVQVIFDQNSTPIIQFGELLVITLLIPGSVFSAIAGERERATWEAVVLTRLTPGQIIVGKMAWRVFIVISIQVLLSVSLVISQVGTAFRDSRSVSAVISGQALIFCWGLFLAAFGLWVSSNNRKAIAAAGILFSVLFAVLALFPTLMAIMNVNIDFPTTNSDYNPPYYPFDNGVRCFMFLNPFYMLGWLMTSSNGSLGMHVPQWSTNGLGWILAALYLAAGCGFLVATARTLKKLEEPKRRSE